MKRHAFFPPHRSIAVACLPCGCANEEEKLFWRLLPRSFRPPDVRADGGAGARAPAASARELDTDRHARTLQGIQAKRSDEF